MEKQNTLTLGDLTLTVQRDVIKAGARRVAMPTAQGKIQCVARHATNDLAIMVGNGNPEQIRSLRDLARPTALLSFGMNGTPGAPGEPEDSAIPAVAWKAPNPASNLQGKLGESIRSGRNVVVNTPKYASHYVGDWMNSVDCQLKEGTGAR